MELNHDRFASHPASIRRRWGQMLGQLVNTTHFDWEELESLCFVFHALTKDTRGVMPQKQFVDLMETALGITNGRNVNFGFKHFDKSNKLVIDMEEWCKAMSIILKGTLQEKSKYCYSAYDRLGFGKIKRSHLGWMVMDEWAVLHRDENLLRELYNDLGMKFKEDSDGNLSPDNFWRAAEKSPLLLEFMGECLPTRSAIQAFLYTACPQAKLPYRF